MAANSINRKYIKAGGAGRRPHALLGYRVVETSWGHCGLLYCQVNCCSLLRRIFPAHPSQEPLLKNIKAFLPRPRKGRPSPPPAAEPLWIKQLAAFLTRYYQDGYDPRGKSPDFWPIWRDVVDWSVCTPFDQAVLARVAVIPPGQTITYGELAQAIGREGSARAVGGALGRNPFPILIPCHRVLGANGKMTGFSAPGSVGAKQRMLALESQSGCCG